MHGSYIGWRRVHDKGCGTGLYNKFVRTIMKRNAKLRIIRKILVRLGDVGLKVFEE